MIAPSDAGQLTRTTLQVEPGGAGASIALMIRALQRVPGVLLAEVNTTNARAVVAHDAAVTTTSLIAAAKNAGVHVRIVGGPRATLVADSPAARLRFLEGRQLLIAAAVSFAIVAAVDSMVPNPVQKHVILIALTVSFWAFFLARSLRAKP